MTLPRALQLALVPIGVAIAHKGLSYLSDEADRLTAELETRRADLAAAAPAGERCPACAEEGLTVCYGADAAPAPTADTPPDRPHRRRRWVLTPAGRLFWHAAAFGVGAYLGLRAQQVLAARALDADLVAAAIRDNEAAPLDEPDVAPDACGVLPPYGEPNTPCTAPARHLNPLHTWER